MATTTAAARAWVRNDPRLTFDEATHTYRLGDRRLISVTQVLAATGLADFSAPWFTDAVKERGSVLHEAVRLDVTGELDETALDDELRGGVSGWRAFLADTQATIDYAEERLCDPELGLAGRLDYIVRIPERGRAVPTLLDLKRALYPSAAIQTAAYADLAAALYDGPVFFRRAALVLPGDGTYRLHPFTDVTDRATWQAAVRIVHWRQAHGLIGD